MKLTALMQALYAGTKLRGQGVQQTRNAVGQSHPSSHVAARGLVQYSLVHVVVSWMLRKRRLIGSCRDIHAHMDILVHRDFSRGIVVGAWKDSRTGAQEDKRAWMTRQK